MLMELAPGADQAVLFEKVKARVRQSLGDFNGTIPLLTWLWQIARAVVEEGG